MTTSSVAVEDEDGFTELRDASVPRVDGVSAAANGTPWFFAKQAEEQRGLFDPDFVRELIEKADPQSPAADPRETVTMSGSPAAIAALIHGASVRKATAEPAAVEPDEFEKADMSAAALNNLPDSAFAVVNPAARRTPPARPSRGHCGTTRSTTRPTRRTPSAAPERRSTAATPTASASPEPHSPRSAPPRSASGSTYPRPSRPPPTRPR
jgi:hypothetical protein